MYTIWHAVAGYLFLVLTVRALARRPGAQMTPFEFVLVFLIGGVIIAATVGDDHSLTNCFGAVVVICLLHRLVTRLKRYSLRFGAWIDGTPVLLLKNDEWQVDSMRQMRVNETDVMAAARAKGVRTLADIKYAVLERNGGISIVKKEKKNSGA